MQVVLQASFLGAGDVDEFFQFGPNEVLLAGFSGNLSEDGQ